VITANKFTVSCRRVVNVAKYESFEFALSLEVEVNHAVSTKEQIQFAQIAIRSQIDKEVERLVADLNLPPPEARG
jgi:hypothetical protein